ncbi:hypothetical protein EFA69_13830 [Rufibacter immobilis]|uniref:Uncharacterized protein n=1 Tax=Rufibacter immobilis TaxID=1348778 RepID=A0A3M9MNZ8_9BACT|nr:hypothetical protein EFA69_13830 [Rufibacter immobilis]
MHVSREIRQNSGKGQEESVTNLIPKDDLRQFLGMETDEKERDSFLRLGALFPKRAPKRKLQL